AAANTSEDTNTNAMAILLSTQHDPALAGPTRAAQTHDNDDANFTTRADPTQRIAHTLVLNTSTTRPRPSKC
ncbi:hypothetical protein, partial [Mycobacterium riyadhense]|uniref:hypothetical protein n=1 Tax=Mycobacterium riyadhense TaxID=486698 RepID=UPI0021F2EB6D